MKTRLIRTFALLLFTTISVAVASVGYTNKKLDTNTNQEAFKKANNGSSKENNGSETNSDKNSNTKEYEYITAEDDGNKIILKSNGTFDDDTKVYNGKTLKEYKKYADKNVLEKGRSIDTQFLTELVEYMFVDKDFIKDKNKEQLYICFAFCSTIANEFYSEDIKINSYTLNREKPEMAVINLTVDGKDDVWEFNFNEGTLKINNGKTDYESSMFSKEVISIWYAAAEDFFSK